MHSHIYTNTEKAMTYLIDNCIEMQELMKERNFVHIRGVEYLKSYGMVRISGPRRTGHTTTIFNLCESFEKPAVMFPTFAMADNMAPENSKATIYTANSFETRMRGVHHDILFVDCAFSLGKEKENKVLESFYNCSMSYKTPCVVFVE